MSRVCQTGDNFTEWRKKGRRVSNRVSIPTGPSEVDGLGRSVEVLTKHLSDLFSNVVHEPLPEALLQLLSALEAEKGETEHESGGKPT